ncbi:MAG: hypothetical protein LCH87_15910 [Actinobacteria bacterium]|nr:hypothetical protein [Actinomycetota bacterium]
MAVFAYGSASGSPGVTTTVLALGFEWPRPVVVVEADPVAGSAILAGFFRGVVEPTGGLVELMVAQRQDHLAERLPSVLLPIPDSQVKVLPGIQTRAQGAGLESVWSPLLSALRALEDTGTDVLIDAGRLPWAGPLNPLVLGADVVLLATGSSLPAVAPARALAADLADQRPSGAGLLVIGPDRPYSTSEVSKGLGLPAVGRVEWDPRAAAVYSRGEPPARRAERSAFLRSIRATGEAVRDFADAARRPNPHALSIGGVR